MREILFRGKRVDNGEWIYGCLLKVTLNGKTAHLIFGDNFRFDGNDVKALSHALVDPSTVGQYTGLTDKNGKRIFEGDVVDVLYDVEYVGVAAQRMGRFEVVFHNGCFMKKNKHGLFHFTPSDKCKAVGTVHDHPELLEGGTDNGV